MNTDGTGFYTCKECHKTEYLWNHTATDRKEGEQLEDQRSVGASSCKSGDGTDKRVQQSLMFMMMMMMMMMIVFQFCDTTRRPVQKIEQLKFMWPVAHCMYLWTGCSELRAVCDRPNKCKLFSFFVENDSWVLLSHDDSVKWCRVISCVVLLWFDVCWCYGVVRLGWCGILMCCGNLMFIGPCIILIVE